MPRFDRKTSKKIKSFGLISTRQHTLNRKAHTALEMTLRRKLGRRPTSREVMLMQEFGIDEREKLIPIDESIDRAKKEFDARGRQIWGNGEEHGYDRPLKADRARLDLMIEFADFIEKTLRKGKKW